MAPPSSHPEPHADLGAAAPTLAEPGAAPPRPPQIVATPHGTPPSIEIAAFVHAATLPSAPSPPSPKEAATLPTDTAPSWSERWSAAQLPVVDPESYEIHGEVAQGGIGRVLRAADRRLKRPVAIKHLLDRRAGAEQRFVREALVTARLQHPAIVPIYEAGRWPSGEPFYAMKLVSGRSLEEVIAEQPTLERRLGLLRHVLAAAEAVAYAHAQRVIHRDLKPANVLCGDFGETVVIDWGLAKDLGEGEDDPRDRRDDAIEVKGAQLTLAGAVIGTPAYMPPEQAAGLRVDERADVYALGAILYHLLAGVPPYDGVSARAVLLQVLAGPPVPLTALLRDAPEELLAIVEKAMAREPTARYRTARELCEDIQRFETGQIVGAHRYSALLLLRRFVRRWRAPLAVGAAALVALAIVGAIGVRRTLAERERAEQQRAEAEAAKQEALARADELTLAQARASLERDPGAALSWLRGLSPQFRRWGEVRLIAADAIARGLSTTLRGHEALLNAVAFSPDGRALATGSDDRTVMLWDVATGQGRRLVGHTDEVWNLAFSPDGRLLFSGSKDRTARVWDVATGAEQRVIPCASGVFLLVPSPDGAKVVISGEAGDVTEVDLQGGGERRISSGGRLIALAPGARFTALLEEEALSLEDINGGRRVLERWPRAGQDGSALQLSRDARWLAHLTHEGELKLWDIAAGEARVLGRLPTSALPSSVAAPRRLTFSPDGARLAALEQGPEVRVWDLRTGAEQALRGHENAVMRAVFSPDSRLLATAGFDHTARIWDLESGQSWVLHGHEDALRSVTFSPDGRLLATAGSDGIARIFPVAARANEPLPGRGADAALAGISPDGALIAAGGSDGRLWLWEGAGAPRVVQAHGDAIVAAVLSPTGEHVATAGRDGIARVWSRTGEPVGELASTTQAAALALAFSPDGALIAAAESDGNVRTRAVDSGEERVLSGHVGPVRALSFSPDGSLLASGGEDRAVRVWRLSTGEARTLGAHEDRVLSVAFSPDSALLVSGSRDHTLTIWHLASGEARTVSAGGSGVKQLGFLRDGRTLISASDSETGVRLWDVERAAPSGALLGHQGEVTSFAISPDGWRLATASRDRTVRLWDLEAGGSRALAGHEGAVIGVAFSPDGQRIVSLGSEGTARQWADDLPRDEEALRAFVEALAPAPEVDTPERVH